MMLDIDYRIFRVLNGLAGESAALDFVWVALADYVLFLMIAGLALFILMKKRAQERRAVTLQALTAAFIGRALIVSLIRIFFYRVRPFVAASVFQLLSHNPMEASFPSGHATVMFALAFPLFQVSIPWGIFYFVLAAASSLSRVIAGVHFPFDILGGMLVGALSAILSKWLFDFIARRRLVLTDKRPCSSLKKKSK